MTIQNKTLTLAGIPVLETVDDAQEQATMPLVLNFHGWQTAKTGQLVSSYLLAERGFRVLAPDANYHGERQQADFKLSQHPEIFWPIIGQSLQEVPDLLAAYPAAHTVDVMGTSMGGITAIAALVCYETLHGGVSFVGTPAPRDFAAYQLGLLPEKVQAAFAAQKAAILNQIAAFDLSCHPKKLAQRPLFLYNDTGDPTVPYQFTAPYQDQLPKNIVYHVGQRQAHHVPYSTMVAGADFLQAALKK